MSEQKLQPPSVELGMPRLLASPSDDRGVTASRRSVTTTESFYVSPDSSESKRSGRKRTGSGGTSSPSVSVEASVDLPDSEFPLWEERMRDFDRVRCQIDSLPIRLCYEQMSTLFLDRGVLGQGAYGYVNKVEMGESNWCEPEAPPPFVAVKQIPMSHTPGTRLQEIIGCQMANLALHLRVSSHFNMTYGTYLCERQPTPAAVNETGIKIENQTQKDLHPVSLNHTCWLVQELVHGFRLFDVYIYLKEPLVAKNKPELNNLVFPPATNPSLSRQIPPMAWSELMQWSLFMQQVMAAYAFHRTFETAMCDAHYGNWMVEKVPYPTIAEYRINSGTVLKVPLFGAHVRAIDLGLCQPYVLNRPSDLASDEKTQVQRVLEMYGTIPDNHWYKPYFLSDLPLDSYNRRMSMADMEKNLASTSPESILKAQRSDDYRHTFRLIVHPCVIDWVQILINLKAMSSIFPTVWQWVVRNGLWKMASKLVFTEFPHSLYESLISLGIQSMYAVMNAHGIPDPALLAMQPQMPVFTISSPSVVLSHLRDAPDRQTYFIRSWVAAHKRLTSELHAWSIRDDAWYEIQLARFATHMIRQMLFFIFLKGYSADNVKNQATDDAQVQATIELILSMIKGHEYAIRCVQNEIPRFDLERFKIIIPFTIPTQFNNNVYWGYKTNFGVREVLDIITAFIHSVPMLRADERVHTLLNIAVIWIPYLTIQIPQKFNYDMTYYSYLIALIDARPALADKINYWNNVMVMEMKRNQPTAAKTTTTAGDSTATPAAAAVKPIIDPKATMWQFGAEQKQPELASAPAPQIQFGDMMAEQVAQQIVARGAAQGNPQGIPQGNPQARTVAGENTGSFQIGQKIQPARGPFDTPANITSMDVSQSPFRVINRPSVAPSEQIMRRQ